MNINATNIYKDLPTGIMKIISLNWPILLLITATASFGFLVLYSIADGNVQPWAYPQILRFILGMVLIVIMGIININFWQKLSPLIYFLSLILLFFVFEFGESGMGAKRWLDLKFFRLQPSELMKVGLVMVLAYYYHWLAPNRVSKPIWVIFPLVILF